MNPYLALLILTLGRIPLALILLVHLGLAAYTGPGLIIALVLMLLIEASDFLDGFLARRLNLVSEIGATLDPYADSTARMLTFAALASAGLTLWIVPVAMALRDVTVAYCRILITRSGGTASAKMSGKIKAVVQAVGAYALVLGPVLWGPGFGDAASATIDLTGWTATPSVFWISWLVAGATLLSMVEYIAGAARAAWTRFPGRPTHTE